MVGIDSGRHRSAVDFFYLFIFKMEEDECKAGRKKTQQQGLTKFKGKKKIWTPTSSEQDEKSRKCYKMLKNH